MNKLIFAIGLLLTMQYFSSCSLQKYIPVLHRTPKNKGVKVDTASTAINSIIRKANLPLPDTFDYRSAKVDNQALNAQYAALLERKILYTTFSSKCKVTFEDSSNTQEFTANIRSKCDTAIWINISALGGMVQAARVMITPDSCVIINYLQKEITKVTLDRLTSILPSKFDFKSLQNLLMGNLITSGNIDSVRIHNNVLSMLLSDEHFLQCADYHMVDSNLLNNILEVKNTQGQQAVFKMLQFEPIDNRKFATERNIILKNNGATYKVDLYIKNVEFDKPIEMPFVLPKNFKILDK